MSVCFLIGHAQAEDGLLTQIVEVSQHLVTCEGVTQFVVGHYGAFDRLATRAIRQIKKKHPHIQLLLLLPYYSGETAQKHGDGFDGTLYPEGLERVPRRYAIVHANRRMVDKADHIIVYQRYGVGNTYRLLRYAQQAERKGRLAIWRVGDVT